MYYKSEWVPSFDGKKLNVNFWPVDHPKAILYIVHGMCEHSRRYSWMGEYFAKNGIEVRAHDQRGHGKSLSQGDLIGHAAKRHGWQVMVRDVHWMIEHVRQTRPKVPLIILGHSMGTLVTTSYIQKYQPHLDGIILSAMPEDQGPLNHIGKALAIVQQTLLGARSKAKLHTALSFGVYNQCFQPSWSDYDWLSRDSDQVLKYILDPLCGAVATAAFFKDLLGGLISVYKKSNLEQLPKNTPILMLAGNNDPVVGKQWGFDKRVKMLSQYNNAVSSKSYPFARHEIINEKNKQEVWDDILNFSKSMCK